MDGAKLEISGKPVKDMSLSTYKQIPETELEEAIVQSKNIVKPSSVTPEKDGAHEKMLPESETKLSEKSNVNTVDVKFTSNEKQNGDAKVDIGDVKNNFVGLSKEELMKYANDPFWIRLRWFLFIGFWLTWAGMLVGAILIIIAAPKCSPPEPRTWWEEGPLTEVEPDVSELELRNLKAQGVKGVLVEWPEDSYRPIGESQSFVTFLENSKSVGVNVIVDLKPGVSNVWFDQSEKNENGDYNDYYIWGPKTFDSAGVLTVPNNWKSKQNSSAWKLSLVSHKYYLAPGDSPQLNFTNPKVISQFTKVITNFLEAGVKGIRLIGAPGLLIDESLQNEQISQSIGYVHTDYGFYTHSHTEYQSGLGPLLKQWQTIIKNKTENGPLILRENLKTLEPFKVDGNLVIDLPSRAKVFGPNKHLTASQINADLNSAFSFLENKYWALWQHNTSVLPSDVLDIVTLLLPGATLVNKNVSISKTLLELRTSQSVMYGNTTRYLIANNTVFAYLRFTPGNPGYLVALNPTVNRVTVDLKAEKISVPDELTVQLVSNNYNESDIEVKKKADATSLPLSPESAIVLSYVP